MVAACQGSLSSPLDPFADGDPNDAGGTPAETGPLPQRVIRLGLAEYANSVEQLFGGKAQVTEAFVTQSESLLGGYSRFDGLVVNDTLAEDFASAADALAKEAVANLDELLSCDPAASGEDVCAQSFIVSFGARAYRRPLSASERVDAFTLFSASRAKGGFAAGIEDVIAAMVQSPNFLYRTELGGEPAGDGLVWLDDYEIASQLSYMITASAPDSELMAAAQAGQLRTAKVRVQHAERLLATERGTSQLVRFVFEWLGLNRLKGVKKDPNLYPGYSSEAAANMLEDARGLLAEWMADGDLTVAELLAGNSGTPERPGMLTQPAFLTVRADVDQSSPVKRGVFVRREVLCEILPPPPFDVDIVPPGPSAAQTTRERFSEHLDRDGCRVCHSRIDPLGFAFESFDGVGAYRTTENGHPVDASGELVSVSKTTDGAFDDARGLMKKLAASPQVQDCLRRQLFRFLSMQNASPPEESFVQQTNENDVYAALLAFVGSDLFIQRGW